ncbi:MAG: aminodeoxychorismate lyase [Terrimicrobiaceae bacterium]
MNQKRFWTLPSTTCTESILWDRAFRFGMSVFETVAILRGRPLFLDGHIARLERAASELMACSIGPVGAWAQEVLLNELSGETGVARIYCTAGPGGLAEAATDPAGAILYEPAEVGTACGEPITVTVDRAPFAPVPGGWKTGNYWQNLRALAAARAAGFDDAIVSDPAGRVVGSSTGNLFFMRRGRLVTPALETGARPGVVREWVIAQTGAIDDLILADELIKADEVFFTNSRVGIQAVGQIDGHALPSCQLAFQLGGLYRDAVLGHC